MHSRRRVVVTGLGIVSCFGSDVDQFYNALLSGKSGVVPIQEFPCESYPTRFAATIRDFDVGPYIDKKQARRIDPFIRYAMVAGKKALEYAHLPLDSLDVLNRKRCGVLIGSGMGGMTMFCDGIETLLTKGHQRITPFFIPYIITNMAGALLAIDLGFMGPNYSISTACATSSYCIYAAAEHIRRGEADLMLCGGTESPITPIGLAGFVACKALSENNEEPTKASRPWDKKRDGFVMGEGSGVLVLESLEHALKRGAPILGEYLGGAVSCDAYHMTSPREDGEGVAFCIESALKDAQIAGEKVSYVNAHATSTLAGDLCEIHSLRSVFGPHIHQLQINATKSMIGHSLGAAGVMGSIATILAMKTKRVHPTINLEDPEEAVRGLNLLIGEQQALKSGAALVNGFGFGGHNSALIFDQYQNS
jgi:3-oxoacyl-[acyl-carrier-protein] synthase II